MTLVDILVDMILKPFLKPLRRNALRALFGRHLVDTAFAATREQIQSANIAPENQKRFLAGESLRNRMV